MTKCRFSELQPGDWFEWNSRRYLCVSSHASDMTLCRAYQLGEGVVFCMSPHNTVTPLPDCTGWDWEPEPETWYRNEYGDCLYAESMTHRFEYLRCNRLNRPYIGYTIRRVWPNGRVEQEFVPAEES